MGFIEVAVMILKLKHLFLLISIVIKTAYSAPKPGVFDKLGSFVDDVVETAEKGSEKLSSGLDAASDTFMSVKNSAGKGIDNTRTVYNKASKNINSGLDAASDTFVDAKRSVQKGARISEKMYHKTSKNINQGVDSVQDTYSDVKKGVEKGVQTGKKVLNEAEEIAEKGVAIGKKGVENTKKAARYVGDNAAKGAKAVKETYHDVENFVIENKERIERNAKRAAEVLREQKQKAAKLLDSASNTLDGLFDRKMALLTSVDFNFKSEKTGELMAVEKSDRQQAAMRSNIKKKPARELKSQNLMVRAYQSFYGLTKKTGDLDQETVELLTYQGDCGNKDQFNVKEQLAIQKRIDFCMKNGRTNEADLDACTEGEKSRFKRDVYRANSRVRRASFGRRSSKINKFVVCETVSTFQA